MDKNKTKSQNGRPSPSVFAYATIGIVCTIVLIHYATGAEYRDKNDIYNWVSLIVEIGIAAGITIAVWNYTKFEQRKTNQLILNINEIALKLDKVINEQNTLHISRKKFLHESLYGNLLSVLTSAYNIGQGNTLRTLVLPDGTKVGELNEYLMLDQMLDVFTERIKQFNDIMSPELYASLSTLCNVLKQKGVGKQYADGLIMTIKRCLNAVDTTLFSFEHIDISILDKI